MAEEPEVVPEGTELPPGVRTITLSYTFFNAEARS